MEKKITIVIEDGKIDFDSSGLTKIEIIGILEFYKNEFLNKKIVVKKKK